MISEEKYEIISHSEPILIENYFNKVFHQLPAEFYQEIVEKENELNIYQYPDPILISDLSNLYQMDVETFSGAFDNKADFFKRKLEKLNYYFTINKKKKKKEQSEFSKYIHSHKNYSNQLTLYILLNDAKKTIKDKINSHKKEITTLNEKIDKCLIEQEEKMNKKLSTKKRRQIHNNNNVSQLGIAEIGKLIDEYLNKFHIIYLHAKIFETPIECLNSVFDELYYQKIQKYYYYQEQIKQFQLLLGDEEEGNQHQESLQFLLSDLEKERTTYFEKIEERTKQIKEKITNKCIESTIEEDIAIKKQKNDLINKLGKLFPND